MRFILSRYLKGLFKYHPSGRLKWHNIDKSTLDTPSIIISNHQSMVDILIYLSLSHKVLILTKDWVWNNPIYGLVVRFCGHVNISPGFEKVLDITQKRISEGCSILVFPEGSRSPDGKIRRFHKGGFYMAQQLNLPIQLFMIHGAWNILPRDTFIAQPGTINIERIGTLSIDSQNERSYYHVAKEANKQIRNAFKEAKKEYETPRFFKHKVIGHYLYKSPILEHYIRVKLRMENNYLSFHQLIPDKCTITDIGCGYGFVDYILALAAPGRKITAIDYDRKKIEVAKNSMLQSECHIEFLDGDIMEHDIPYSDIFLISDMLHYLSRKNQDRLLLKCVRKLNAGGKIIIRDSDTSLKQRQKRTNFSEFLSTKIGFNKAMNKLEFISRDIIEQFANENNLHFEIKDQTRYTSNLIYIMQKYE